MHLRGPLSLPVRALGSADSLAVTFCDLLEAVTPLLSRMLKGS